MSITSHTLTRWIWATRIWSFPVSITPPLVTMAYLYWAGYDINVWYGLWASLEMLLFHCAGNTWSDYKDYINNIDREGAYGFTSMVSGEFTPEEIRGEALVIGSVAAIGGLAMAWLTGWPLIAIGLAGAVLMLLYPASKSRGLGEVVIFATFAALPVLGTTYVTTGQLVWQSLIVSIPFGLITVAVLFVNNFRDREPDAEAGIFTVAMHMHTRVAVNTYAFLVLFPAVWIVGCTILGIFPWISVVSLLAIFPALAIIKTLRQHLTNPSIDINHLDEATAKLEAVLCLLLIITFCIAKWINL